MSLVSRKSTVLTVECVGGQFSSTVRRGGGGKRTHRNVLLRCAGNAQ